MAIIAFDRKAPTFDSRGWIQWPGNEEYSQQFMRLLGAAQDGGVTVSECLLTADAIIPGCQESWFTQWNKTAGLNKARGDAALLDGHLRTASSNWLRAASYYRAAQAFMPAEDVRRCTALDQMAACSRLFLEHATPIGEVVEIPYGSGVPLQGYFLHAPERADHKTPVVLCIGDFNQHKEDLLHRIPRLAHDRGLSVLLVDLPGYGFRQAPDKSFGRYDIETAISGWLDYLDERDDVDPARIAIYGDGLGASMATRGAAFDDRFAAAVCDAGLWNLQERAFLAPRLLGDATDTAPASDFAIDFKQLCRSNIARTVRCPMLVALGEHEGLNASHVTQCCDALVAAGRHVELRLFNASETAFMPAQPGSLAIGSEFIFDWIADRLGSD